jgi:hypothetical protein
MKCNETQGKWCKNKHGASKIIDTFETYQSATSFALATSVVSLLAVVCISSHPSMQFYRALGLVLGWEKSLLLRATMMK